MALSKKQLEALIANPPSLPFTPTSNVLSKIIKPVDEEIVAPNITYPLSKENFSIPEEQIKTENIIPEILPVSMKEQVSQPQDIIYQTQVPAEPIPEQPINNNLPLNQQEKIPVQQTVNTDKKVLEAPPVDFMKALGDFGKYLQGSEASNIGSLIASLTGDPYASVSFANQAQQRQQAESVSKQAIQEQQNKLDLLKKEYEYKKELERQKDNKESANELAKKQKVLSAISDFNLMKTKIEKLDDELAKIPSGRLGGAFTLGKTKIVGEHSEDAPVASYNAIKSLTLSNLSRTLGGERGVLTDNDIKRIEEGFPKITDTKQERSAKIKMIKGIIDDAISLKLDSSGVNSSDFYTPMESNNVKEQKQGGQLMIDANGNKAIVYDDGTYEEVK